MEPNDSGGLEQFYNYTRGISSSVPSAPRGAEGTEEEGEESEQDKDPSEPDSAPNIEEAEIDEESDEEEGDENEDAPITARERLLLKRIQELEARSTSRSVEEGPPAISPLMIEDQERDFIGNEDVDDILGDKSRLNTLLNKVFNDAMATAAKLSAEHILSNLPATISHYARRQVEVYSAVAAFYAANPDLNNDKAREYMGSVGQKIVEENPGIDTDVLFKRAATRVRKLLALKSQGNGKQKKNPGFARPGRTGERHKGGQDQLTDLEREMFAMIPR